MSKVVSNPGECVPVEYRNIIQKAHTEEFEFPLLHMEDYWWLFESRQGITKGFAGARPETDDCVFLGPCVVFPEFRGQGVQRTLIRARERLAVGNKFIGALTYAHYKNYKSLNNFIRNGYRIIPNWEKDQSSDGTYIYLRKDF